MLDQPSLKNLQPPDMPKRRIARRLVSMVIVFCGMLMALESILGGQMTSRQFRVDEANQELRFALSVGNSLRTLNPSDDAPPTEFARSGIKEEIGDKFKKRYEKWKTEYLSTEAGRNQWDMYEHKKRFLLTIRISKVNPHGPWRNKNPKVEAACSREYSLADSQQILV